MKRRAADRYDPHKEKFTRHAAGSEYNNYPTPLARQIWYYPLSIGTARWHKGMEFHHPQRGFGHRHDGGYLLHFVERGELLHQTKQQQFTVRRNEAALLDLHQPVHYCNRAATPALFHWLWLDGKDMPRIFAELNAETEPIFRSMRPRRVRDMLGELSRVIASEPRGYEARTSALLATLLADLFAERAPMPVLTPTHVPLSSLSGTVRRVIAYLNRYYNEPLALKEISRIFGVSVSYLSHAFQREIGSSPMQYVQQHRIEQAKKLLAETNPSIEHIARSVGIPNTQHFSKLFRQLNGVSPRTYRQRSVR